ncbi:MAG: glycosyltransferase [Bacteroidales bacterium]|nr:glycosyltransferase [Bacteroidales bacterium]
MIKTLKISIIVPVYNAEKYLFQCIESIRCQTYNNFELLLINDGSADRSGKICDEYTQVDQRIKVIHKENGGVSSARNTGIEMAKGKYLLFIDSDDWIEPKYIESFLHSELGDDELTFIIHDILKETGNEIKKNCNFPNKTFSKLNYSELFAELKLFRFGYPFSKLYSSRIIQQHNIRFDTKIHFSEDLLFMLEYVKYVKSIRTSSSAMYHYVNVNSSSLARSYHSFESELACFNKAKTIFQDLIELYKLNKNAEKYIQISLGHFILRSTQSLYRPKHKKNHSDRIRILRSIMTSENAVYFSQYTSFRNDWIYAIPCILFEKRMFQLFDIYLNTSFFIRYNFELIWKLIRKFR